MRFLKKEIEASPSSGTGSRSLPETQDMSKIRINELARELEVKPNVILDLLPELGVQEKKTHSSSLDDDVALAVRRRLGGNGSVAVAEAEPEEETLGARTGDRGVPAIERVSPPPPSPAEAHAGAPVEAPVEAKSEHVTPPAVPPAQTAETAARETVDIPVSVKPVSPLRPPLATGHPV